MLIIVTGNIGSGKTTVCSKLLDILRTRERICTGILTRKGPDGSIVIEDVASGEKMTLARIDNTFIGPRTVKYSFDPRGIDFGLRAIHGPPGEVIFIDEIGILELRGEGFASALELINAGSFKNCLVVIREWLLPDFLPRLPANPLIFQTTTENRDRLPGEIASKLLET